MKEERKLKEIEVGWGRKRQKDWKTGRKREKESCRLAKIYFPSSPFFAISFLKLTPTFDMMDEEEKAPSWCQPASALHHQLLDSTLKAIFGDWDDSKAKPGVNSIKLIWVKTTSGFYLKTNPVKFIFFLYFFMDIQHKIGVNNKNKT